MQPCTVERDTCLESRQKLRIEESAKINWARPLCPFPSCRQKASRRALGRSVQCPNDQGSKAEASAHEIAKPWDEEETSAKHQSLRKITRRCMSKHSESYTVLVLWMAQRKWKDTKQQPGTAGPGNMLGCCLISLHYCGENYLRALYKHPSSPTPDVSIYLGRLFWVMGVAWMERMMGNSWAIFGFTRRCFMAEEDREGGRGEGAAIFIVITS